MRRFIRYLIAYLVWTFIFMFGFFVMELKIDTFKKFCGLQMIVTATFMTNLLVHHYFKYKEDERRISNEENKK